MPWSFSTWSRDTAASGQAGRRCGGVLTVHVRSGDGRDLNVVDGCDDRDEYEVAHVTDEVKDAREVLTPERGRLTAGDELVGALDDRADVEPIRSEVVMSSYE